MATALRILGGSCGGDEGATEELSCSNRGGPDAPSLRMTMDVAASGMVPE
jgi:hypothetical protein